MLDELAVDLSEHRSRDRRIGDVGATAHHSQAGLVVTDDAGDSAGGLNIDYFLFETASAAIYNGNFTGNIGCINDGITAKCAVGSAVGSQGQFADERHGSDRGAEVGDCRLIAAGYFFGLQDVDQPAACLVPQKHLHAAVGAVGGSREIGIIGTAAVLGFCEYIVIALAAVSVVVLMEVARLLVKTIGIGKVVHDVVHIKQLSHGCVFVGRRFLRSVVKREIENQVGAAVGAGAVGRIVGICINIGVDVIAAGKRKLWPRSAVGVVPAKRRSLEIVRIDYQFARAVNRAFNGDGKYVVSITGKDCFFFYQRLVNGLERFFESAAFVPALIAMLVAAVTREATVNRPVTTAKSSSCRVGGARR